MRMAMSKPESSRICAVTCRACQIRLPRHNSARISLRRQIGLGPTIYLSRSANYGTETAPFFPSETEFVSAPPADRPPCADACIICLHRRAFRLQNQEAGELRLLELLHVGERSE